MTKMKTAVVVTSAALLSVLSLIPVKSNRPLIEDKYFGKNEKILFIPAYNYKQPNRVILEATPAVLEWMKKNGFEKGNAVAQEKTAEDVTHRIYSQRNTPLGPTIRKYVNELKEKQRSVATAEDFLRMDSLVCLEKTAFLATVLRQLGIDAQIFVIESVTKGGDYIMHYFVAAKTGNEKLMLDPSYGEVERNQTRFKVNYLKKIQAGVVKTKVYPLIKYEPKYEKYLKTDSDEKALDKKFWWLKKKVD